MTSAAQNSKEQEKFQQIIKDVERLKSKRTAYNNHCLEIAQRIAPEDVPLFSNLNGAFKGNPGEKRSENVFDSTASIASERFAAILDSLLTPRNQKWHYLRPSIPELEKDREVLLYFEEVNRRLFRYRYAPNANFTSQNHLNYMGLGRYGTGCMFTDALRTNTERGLRYKSIHISEILFEENHQGIIDRAHRIFTYKPSQIRKRFPTAVLPDEVLSHANADKDYEIVHSVIPRDDVDFERLDFKGKPYASYYLLKLKEPTLLEEDGYDSFPYSPSRYMQTSGETTGRGPAMTVLPAIKTLNEEKKTVLKQGQRVVDPVLLAHDDGIVDGFSLRPGAINIGGVNADGRALVQALPSGNIMIGKELMDDERAVINDAFLVSIFQILKDTPEMTAYEVMERTREKGILLAPTVGRQHSEYLGPMINRELEVLRALGLLPPMPKALIEAQGEYTVVYDSPISRAQRAEEAAGVMSTLQFALEMVNVTQDPSALDHFNMEVIVPAVADIRGVPLSWMNSMDKINQIRQGRAQQKETEQVIQAAPAAAAVMKQMAPKSK